MREYTTIQYQKKVPVKLICDKCGATNENPMFREGTYIHEISLKADYPSKFDGATIQIDLCDHCLEELLKQLVIEPQGMW